MSTPKKYQMPMRFRWFKFTRWVLARIAYAIKRVQWAIERKAEFDPLVWAAAEAGELRMTVDPCTTEWELHIRVKSRAYKINELDVVRAGYTMRDAIDRVCWEHCMKNKILP